MQAQVQLPDGAGTQPARRAVLAAGMGQPVVQLLDVQSPKRADGVLAEVGTHVVVQQLAVAADGSQPEGLVGLQVGEPVVQQLVEGRLCPPTNATAWLLWTVGGQVVAVAAERLVERRSRGGLGGVAAQVVEPPSAVVVGGDALDAWVPAHAPRRAPALGLLVALHALAFDGAAGHGWSFRGAGSAVARRHAWFTASMASSSPTSASTPLVQAGRPAWRSGDGHARTTGRVACSGHTAGHVPPAANSNRGKRRAERAITCLGGSRASGSRAIGARPRAGGRPLHGRQRHRPRAPTGGPWALALAGLLLAVLG